MTFCKLHYSAENIKKNKQTIYVILENEYRLRKVYQNSFIIQPNFPKQDLIILNNKEIYFPLNNLKYFLRLVYVGFEESSDMSIHLAWLQ